MFADGQVRSGGAQRAARARPRRDGDLVAEDAIEYGDLDKKYQQSTFGAHFVEVGVDAVTGETRVRRMLAVCAAGRILNPQVGAQPGDRRDDDGRRRGADGGTGGRQAACGFFVNHDLAGYEVPVHADIPHQDVIFLDETDPMSSPMKAKGVGELGICGVGAAVANAIYNATGVRVRDYPITLDKLSARLAECGLIRTVEGNSNANHDDSAGTKPDCGWSRLSPVPQLGFNEATADSRRNRCPRSSHHLPAIPSRHGPINRRAVFPRPHCN